MSSDAQRQADRARREEQNRGGKKLKGKRRRHVGKRPASAGDVERITATLLEVLYACGYLHAKSGKVPREKVRRLLRRHKLSANDADLWLSMLGQILYKLRKR